MKKREKRGAEFSGRVISEGLPAPMTKPWLDSGLFQAWRAMPQLGSQRKSGGSYARIVGFIGAFGLGFGVYSSQPAKKPASAEVQALDGATSAKIRVLQQRLAEIGQRRTATIDDYIRNTTDAAPIIEEAKGLVPLQMASVDRFKREHASNGKDVITAAYALRMFQKDGELLSLMGNEIYCVRALQALPSTKRVAYYNENVLPLKKKERLAAKEWAALAQEAADKGVSWSEDVSKATEVLQ